MTHTEALPTSHAQREASAYAEWYAAAMRKDWVEAARLWQVFKEIHAERPAAVVDAFERAKGLR